MQPMSMRNIPSIISSYILNTCIQVYEADLLFNLFFFHAVFVIFLYFIYAVYLAINKMLFSSLILQL